MAWFDKLNLQKLPPRFESTKKLVKAFERPLPVEFHPDYSVLELRILEWMKNNRKESQRDE